MNPKATESTGFRFYSFGIVVEDKVDDGDYIKVTPIEELPLLKGKLSEISFDYNVQGIDHKEVNVSASVKGVGFVIAKWAPIESGNRNTAPNVYEGETVLLIKYGNTDDVYWTDLFREPKLRRLENVVHSFSNLPDKDKTPYDQETSYWIQISTRDQVLKLHTSDNNKEPVTYDITIDTGRGTFQIIDSNQNQFFLDSVNSNLEVDIQNNAVFNIKNLLQFNADKVEINGQSYIHSKAPDIKEQGDTNTTTTSQSIKEQSSGTIESTASATNTIRGSMVLINS